MNNFEETIDGCVVYVCKFDDVPIGETNWQVTVINADGHQLLDNAQLATGTPMTLAEVAHLARDFVRRLGNG